MRQKLRLATVAALDRFGYSETSIARVRALAEVSSGALTHHYASKQALICDTVDMLLNEATQRSLRLKAPPVAAAKDALNEAEQIKAYFLSTWRRIVDTAAGRALIEILVAVRTDADLQAQLSDRLAEWDREMNAAAAEVFVSARGDEDLRVVWGICRTFFRGLILHQRFVKDRAALGVYVERFADLVAGQLRLRR